MSENNGPPPDERVKINVGGKLFETYVSTLRYFFRKIVQNSKFSNKVLMNSAIIISNLYMYIITRKMSLT